MGRRSGEPGDDWYSKNCAFTTLMIGMVAGIVGTALALVAKRSRSDHD